LVLPFWCRLTRVVQESRVCVILKQQLKIQRLIRYCIKN